MVELSPNVQLYDLQYSLCSPVTNSEISQGGCERRSSEPSGPSKRSLRKARRAMATSGLNDDELGPLVDVQVTDIFSQPTLNAAMQVAYGHLQTPSLD